MFDRFACYFQDLGSWRLQEHYFHWDTLHRDCRRGLLSLDVGSVFARRISDTKHLLLWLTSVSLSALGSTAVTEPPASIPGGQAPLFFQRPCPCNPWFWGFPWSWARSQRYCKCGTRRQGEKNRETFRATFLDSNKSNNLSGL